MAVQTLLQLPPGTSGRLVAVDGEPSFRRRLMELGLLPGTPVRLVRRVNVHRLVELEVRGCRVSLRCAEAARLSVEEEA
jgi:Fe2+ transport system protein FeoA